MLGLVSIIFTWLYFSKFNQGLSSKQDNWGNFGSYFSETIGAVLSGLNLLVLIYLTFKLNKDNNQQWLTELRSPFYKEIIWKLKSFNLKKSLTAEEIEDFNLWLKHLSLENHLFLVTVELQMKAEKAKNDFFNAFESATKGYNSDIEINQKTKGNFILYRDKLEDLLGDIMMNRAGKDAHN